MLTSRCHPLHHTFAPPPFFPPAGTVMRIALTVALPPLWLLSGTSFLHTNGAMGMPREKASSTPHFWGMGSQPGVDCTTNCRLVRDHDAPFCPVFLLFFPFFSSSSSSRSCWLPRCSACLHSADLGDDGEAVFNPLLSVLLPEQLFGGNSDKDTERMHFLNSPFVARYVRFHPVEWHGKISMRAGLFGCPYTGRPSGKPSAARKEEWTDEWMGAVKVFTSGTSLEGSH